MENFVITIARQYGSGGRTVGKMLAEKLGVSFYDKQIIQMASDESGIDVKLFGQVEEGSSVKASLFNKTGLYKGDLIAPDQKGFVSDENIFNYQAKIATDLAEKESCVIVGRCVNYVFKDRPNTLRVFVHAPWEFRVEKSREKISGSDEEIEKFLTENVLNNTSSDHIRSPTGLQYRFPETFLSELSEPSRSPRFLPDDPYSESLPLQAVFSLTETTVVHLPFRHIK